MIPTSASSVVPVSSVKPHTGPGTGAGMGSITAVTAPLALNSTKLRQDIRRSASVGTPPLLPSGSDVNTKPGVVRSSQQSFTASIATLGVPSPRAKHVTVSNANSNSNNSTSNVNVVPNVSRVVSGASYATALKTGAVTGLDDSEASLTDQLLIASLHSDLLSVQNSSNPNMTSKNNLATNTKSNSSTLYGGLFGESTHSLPSSSVIERPPRSLSEPVIQLPQKMTPDYFKNQLSLIQGRSNIGVGALGGAFNPVSPLQPSYGSMSPLQKAMRSPVIAALASPLSPLPSLGLAWLSPPATATQSDATIDATQLTSTTTVEVNEFFPPLPPSNSNVAMLSQIGQQVVGRPQQQQQQQQQQQPDYQQLQYMQQQYLQQIQQMQQQQAFYQNQSIGLFNPSLILNQQQQQQQMGMQMIGQQGVHQLYVPQLQVQMQGQGQGQIQGQGQVPQQTQGQLGTEAVPTPLAWAAMSGISQGQQQLQQQLQQQQQLQYFEPQQQQFQQNQQFQTMTQQQYQYQQQQQYHMQMQQHLQQGQYNMNMGIMGISQNGITFPLQQQSNQLFASSYITHDNLMVTQQQQQQQQQQQIQGRGNSQLVTGSISAAGNSLIPVSVSGSTDSVIGTSSVSGAASRSGSQLEGSAASGNNLSYNSKVSVVGDGNIANGNSNMTGNGMNSNVAVKDELFLFEGLRLDGDAPEFEPQSQIAARGW